MNSNRYRLVFSATAGMLLPLAETARGRGKAASGSVLLSALFAGGLLCNAAQAEMPVPSRGGVLPNFVTAGQALYQLNGNQAFVNQVGDKSILNWQSFNISAGNTLQFRQVDSLGTNSPVAGASFTSLNRIWDINPSVIAGSITQGAGQKANVILVNTNGIAFMGGAQVDLNSFTASSLDIADNFVLNSLLGNNQTAQFQGTGGFVKVFEGAQITAGSQGRVMLIAPTVVNQGSVTAPDGQVILAAGSKVYLRAADDANLNLRGLLVEVDSPTGLNDFQTPNTGVKNGVLDGQAVALSNASTDMLGNATNLGELSAPRGNVTMVGYAVNQMGIARATTSVVANGSVYLLAKDSSAAAGSSRDSTRGGRVVLGGNSLTEVLPETGDATTSLDGSTGAGLAQASEVRVLGQTVYMAGGASIHAPAGKVDLIAVDDPSTLVDKTTLDLQGTPASTTARVQVANAAIIDVAGLTDVQVSAARNAVEVQLRGDELKDSPINQQGPLRGQTVYMDVNAALDNANAGKATLIAKDSLLAYQALQARTVAERSTVGGTVNIRSQGEAIVQSGAVVDLSGGSLSYTPANVKTTLLRANGKLVDLADAVATTRYDSIATRFVVDYGRWNKTDVIDAGQSFRFDPGYTEGKSAGSLNVQSMGAAFMQADILGRTTVGARQGAAGLPPQGATFTLGAPDIGPPEAKDYKLNQQVVFDSASASLPAGFGMGDALPDALKNTLDINTALLAKDKVANLNVYTNQGAEVRSALSTPQGGSVTIVANDLTVKADIAAPSGSINLAARNNVVLPNNAPQLTVSDGVQLTARGAWVNDSPGLPAGDGSLPLIDGGSISLAADSGTLGRVSLGQGVNIDASGGAHLTDAGKIVSGKGGSISFSGYAAEGLPQNLSAYGLDKGGSLSVTANRIKIGGEREADFGTLMLDPLFFTRGGFASYSLTGLSTLELAQNTQLRPQVTNRELIAGQVLPQTGAMLADFSQWVVRDDLTRQATNLSLTAKQGSTETGDLLIGKGSSIVLDPTGSIALTALNSIDIEGALVAHGGAINVGLAAKQINQNSLWLGQNAVLDVSGLARTYIDAKGLTQGTVLAGGTVNLNAQTGYVVAEAGSRIDLSGAAPVQLDQLNPSGGLGRMVGSDAGALTVFGEQGILLDATLAAHGGGADNRGGSVSITLSKNARLEQQAGFDSQARTLSLETSVAPQTSGLSAGTAIADMGVVRARIGTDKLEAAAFDSMSFSSRDEIVLADGLALGVGRALPLRELKLDAARIETAGGNVTLQADTLRLGNYDTGNRVGSDGAFTTTGTFTANARLLELAGNLRLRGMASSELTGTEMVQLAGVARNQLTDAGVSTGTYEYSSNIGTTADLTLKGAVIAPGSYASVSISAPDKTVRFEGVGTAATQPLSALGSLRVDAADIVQSGTVWAPLGSIDLVAQNSLTLNPGSLTSVAAAPGSLLPLGQIQNSSNWVVNVNPTDVPTGQIKLTGLPEKSVRLSGAVVNMRTGATVDLAGGGDLQAYEFTVGPGGSHDILTDPNTYAIVPGYRGGFAPSDPQEALSRASGTSVYLTGVPGLAAGTYTLLPAHYALLPGAFAVVLGSAGALLPDQAYTRQDGVAIAAGYVTDTRANAPRDANWQGIEVLSRDQVLARSELTLTPASAFFSGGKNLPQDAALLSVAAQGTLTLDATFRTAAAAGGRGAGVDISVPALVLDAGNSVGIDPLATHIDVAKLNALAAGSLLLGATRNVSGDSTALTVGADRVTLANDAEHALTAGEVILAAKDTVTLKAGSLIDAQGQAGDAGHYSTAGNGALLRAGATSATLERSGSPDRSLGTLIAEVGSTVRAADSIVLDATHQNAFQGTTEFNKNGAAVAGNLALGATRINFGAAPLGAEGATYTQSVLDGLNSLKSLALTSYSSFDFYGNVNVGGIDANGKPTLQNMTLQGTGLAGLNNNGNTAKLQAQNLTLSNPTGSAFAPAGPMGNGTLTLLADTLTLGQGDKAVQGFSSVAITANELVGAGQGTTTIAAPTEISVARISGGLNSDQALSSNGALTVASRIADRALLPVTALGAKWAFTGTSVDFNTQVELPSGQLQLKASGGDLTLGAAARVDLAGRGVAFFDVTRPTWGGTAEFSSNAGNVSFASGANVDVSAAPGADAGTLIIGASQGTVTLADGSVAGNASPDAKGKQGAGGRVQIDTGTLASFSALNTALNSGGFAGERTLRVRTGDVTVAAGDTTGAQTIHIEADKGKINVAGQLDASGNAAGRIELLASSDVNIQSGAKLDAISAGAGKNGGDIEIGTSTGRLNLAAASTMNVTGGSGAVGGKLLLRAPRTGAGAGTDVAVSALQSTVTGASALAVEAVKVYSGITTLTATGASSGATLSLATINADDNTFATNYSAIKSRVGAATAVDILSGVEVRSVGDLTLGTGTAATDWNLANSRAGAEPGVLTLRAAGNLLIKSNLSDGFSAATPLGSGTTPATLVAGNSWSYRLIAGADSASADPMAVAAAKDFSLAAGKLIRTGTGDIQVAAGQDIKLTDTGSVIYTAGRAADTVSNFTAPTAKQYAYFTQGGGDVSLAASRNIVGTASTQLYSDWLFRQGSLNADGSAYAASQGEPAWWVRFDQFKQGVATLGGGDVSIVAGGRVSNLSASAPTQARMSSSTPDPSALVKTGGGTVRVEAGTDVLGGQYFADDGDVVLKVGGMVGSGQSIPGLNDLNVPVNKPVYTILALGDAQASVQAQGDVSIHAVINPTLLPQSYNASSSNTTANIVTGQLARRTLFSTYTADSSVALESLAGTVTLHNTRGDNNVADLKTVYAGVLNSVEGKLPGYLDLLAYLPPSLSVAAFQGDVVMHSQPAGGSLTLLPAPQGQLELLAQNSLRINASITMSDLAPDALASPVDPVSNPAFFTGTDSRLLHAATPVHVGDTTPVRFYANTGDVQGVSLAYGDGSKNTQVDLPKAVEVRAGNDIFNFSVSAQHPNPGDVSVIEAGRDIVFSTGLLRTDADGIRIGGPGRLEVTAGRNIDLGTSGGIVSRGDLDNPNLASTGADIQVLAGAGATGLDVAGTLGRLSAQLAAGATDEPTLWLARWLTGNTQLTADNALTAVRSLAAQDAQTQRDQVREMVFTALRTTGRDHNDATSAFAGDYARGYAALELVFPGIGEKNPDGSFKNYQGNINLFASRIKTERGGNIEFMVPGGEMVVGLANTPANLVNVGNNVLGIVAAGSGDIKGFSRGNMLVNQSRILTVGGGDVMLWSSEGDIDAGKGKKTASAVPPPVIKVDAQGNVTQELQGAASGSGIGALSSGGVTAGDVDLIAPKGTVNAGDAGIRAGNLNIAALVVQGADNISVSGRSTGTPVADTSAVTAAASGATSSGDDVSKAVAALSQVAAEAAKSAQALSEAFKPAIVNVEVLGYGE